MGWCVWEGGGGGGYYKLHGNLWMLGGFVLEHNII